MANKLIIAAAGSGKTTTLIQEALSIKDEQILITTYTEANAEEIKRKLISIVGFIPSNIFISTWFSLLIRHGVKPYQSYLFDFKLRGMLLMSTQSGIQFRTKAGVPIPFSEEKHFEKHYFSPSHKVYSDKLAKLVIRMNAASEGKVLNRLTSIYPHIFIDEAQDLAGFDLEIIRLLSIDADTLTMSCDPRQVTYLTHNPKKFKKYRNGRLKDYLLEECDDLEFSIDETTLAKSHRCNDLICEFSNSLYPEIEPCESSNSIETDHDGVFLVVPEKIDEYILKYSPTQLRWNVREMNIRKEFDVLNIGQAKGLSFDRVLVYPTESMIDWIKDNKFKLKEGTRAKLYVSITRARYSAALVIPKFDGEIPPNCQWY